MWTKKLTCSVIKTSCSSSVSTITFKYYRSYFFARDVLFYCQPVHYTTLRGGRVICDSRVSVTLYVIILKPRILLYSYTCNKHDNRQQCYIFGSLSVRFFNSAFNQAILFINFNTQNSLNS